MGTLNLYLRVLLIIFFTFSLVNCSSPNIIRSNALTIGQWVIKDSKKVYYIQVESSENTLEQAKQAGFKQAVSQAVGTLVVSETEVKNQQLLRQEVIQYSSGYIDDFKIIAQTQSEGKVKIVMDVWVVESKIADRLLNVSQVQGQIDGNRTATQIKSVINEMLSSDQLLESIARDFPKRAFNIKLGKAIVKRTGGGAQIVLPVKIGWHKSYIDGLIEVLEKTRDGRFANSYNNHPWGSVISYRGSSAWRQSIASYHDQNKLQILANSFINSRPVLRLQILGSFRSPSFDQCYRYSHFGNFWGERTAFGYMRDRFGNTLGQFYYVDGDSPGNNNYSTVFHIAGDFEDDFYLTIDLQTESDIQAVSNMRTFDVSVVPEINCAYVNR